VRASIVIAVVAVGAGPAHARPTTTSLWGGQIRIAVPDGWTHDVEARSGGDPPAVTADRLVKGGVTIRFALSDYPPDTALAFERNAHADDPASDVAKVRLGVTRALSQEIQIGADLHATWTAALCEGTLVITLDASAAVDADALAEARAMIAGARVTAAAPDPFPTDPAAHDLFAHLAAPARARIAQIIDASCRDTTPPATLFAREVRFELEDRTASRTAVRAEIIHAGGLARYLRCRGMWTLSRLDAEELSLGRIACGVGLAPAGNDWQVTGIVRPAPR
jgi:hypothetical protein